MFRTLSRMLVATATVVVIGLAPSLVTPAQAANAPTAGAEAESATTRPNTTTEVIAGSVTETRHAINIVLETNNAAHAWPAVDADLTPKLDAAVAAGGGTVTTSLLDWLPKIKIKCEITFPPLQIRCTVEIIWG